MFFYSGGSSTGDRWIEKSGGKSEHQRAGRSITWSHGDVKESATESRPPLFLSEKHWIS
ncbi:hypothetical protein MTBBW1_80185 [Desulfamplus magnetovallimortis]|uniref:Uncharacterized protein n=1 Tax=Desulfamplus magnetovallimortis TaxID=1246637 RepID=L0R749_9BACT|nr:hypothetical protein DEMABW1_80185 [Desulfamplus magnetovallimortis BW-1]SLM32842.1 hypothetical protein MTBBW1_80185 [Desulfamplus magnetovallimortis]